MLRYDAHIEVYSKRRARVDRRAQSTFACRGFSLLKEGKKNRQQQISSEHNIVMGGAGQNGQLRWDEMFPIPASIPQAVKLIEHLTGLKRSPTQVGIFLKKLGLKRLKTYAVPASITPPGSA